MGWKDFFKKKDDDKLEGPDPTRGLDLKNLEPGYYVDFDLNTWKVTAHNKYDWGGGDISHEWQLESTDETLFLEMESDDEVFWSISRKVPFGKLGSAVKKHIMDHDDPPDEITYDGITYYMEEMGGGKFLKGGRGPGKEMLSWDYADDSGKKYLSIEQWGEEDFEASVGQPVQEYQFSNILPGKNE